MSKCIIIKHCPLLLTFKKRTALHHVAHDTLTKLMNRYNNLVIAQSALERKENKSDDQESQTRGLTSLETFDNLPVVTHKPLLLKMNELHQICYKA